ncbi:MAG TPA: tetratricopeptide repeat protein [Abditibacteriaceae bacterium]|nr:tetratricopeptide repeat protein [Abditibacteriaceae bacterium]
MFSFLKRRSEDGDKPSQSARASTLWAQGSRLLERGQTEQALKTMREAMTLEPSRIEGRLNLGAALLMTNQAEEAIGHFKYVLAFDPQNTMALLNLAAAQDKIGDLDGSVQTLESVVAHRPSWKDAHYNLAVALFRQGEYDKAAEALKAELRINPSHALARDLLTDIHLKVPRRKDHPSNPLTTITDHEPPPNDRTSSS